MPFYPPSSPNITYIDFSAAYNLNTQNVTLNDTSAYKSGGAANVQGICFKIVNTASGVILWNNTNFSSPDIDPDAPAAFTKSLQLFNGAVAYGTYTITMSTKDQDGTIYTLAKATLICKPTQCTGVTASNACAEISVLFPCSENKVLVADQTAYIYQNITTTNITRSIRVTDPNNLLTIGTVSSFQLTPIYMGRYSVIASNTAVYSFGDSVTVTIVYTFNNVYQANCALALCDIYCAFDSLVKQYKAVAGTGAPQESVLKNKLFKLEYLIPQAMIGIECGKDVSAVISDIEAITGLQCACGCGTANINSGATISGDKNIVIESGDAFVGVDTVTVGITQTSTITYDITGALETCSIKDLGDVSDTAPIDGQILQWSDLDGTYDPVTLGLGGGILYENMTPTNCPNNNIENTIYTYTVPAYSSTNNPYNTLSNVGDTLRINIIFQNGLNSNSNDRSIKIKFGSNTFLTLIFQTGVFDLVDMDVEIIRLTNNTEKVNIRYNRGVPLSATANYYIAASGTVNLKVDNDFVVTCQNTSAVANSVTFSQFVVQLIKQL